MANLIIDDLQDALVEMQTDESLYPKMAKKAEQYLSDLSKIDILDNLSEAMDVVSCARNLVRLKLSGIKVEDQRIIDIADDSLKNVPKLPVNEELIKGMAKRLFESATKNPIKKLMIAGNRRNIQILEEIARLCIDAGIDFAIDIVNHEFDVVLVNEADEEGLKRLADAHYKEYEGFPARVEAKSSPDKSVHFDSGKLKKFMTMEAPLWSQFKRGEKHYCLTIIPTPSDAEQDGLEYEEYMKLFFEACDQPWDEIKKAQAVLIERFNAAKEVKITNDDGTDLTFGIDGMTFANSVVLKNVPGPEIFSAPVRDKVNGTLVAKGKFKYKEFDAMEDITLVFENGRVKSFDAKKGRDVLEKIITMDDGEGEGSRYTGEIAFGNNQVLKRHFINVLLVEKISGSFHIALGRPYEYKEYDGVPVNLDNGNKSASDTHWDVTTMLAGKNGKVMLDGVLVQDNGVWVDENGRPDEKLAVLNYGWGALPGERRPQWFKDKK